MTKDAVDPILHKGYLDELADAYLPLRVDRTDARMSPLYPELKGFPPILVQGGAAETLSDDAVRLAAAAGAVDVPITLQIWPHMVDAWPLWNAHLDAGRRVVYPRSHLTRSDVPLR